MATTPDREAHRDFLNRYYGVSRSFYDLTRKYYLFGRDTALRQLAAEPWSRLVEIGPGTGRNLRKLRAMRPDAAYGGVEASDEMLDLARRRCPWARFQQGFAEETDYTGLLGARPDRVLFSYCLSMVQEREKAIEAARRSVSADGEVVIVDFADMGAMRGPAREGLRAWLRTFHVDPLPDELLRPHARSITYGPGRYYVIARLPALPAN
jgi:S-adenosylmethionine-diacylgycerolhomoserine-N-methlytransferase